MSRPRQEFPPRVDENKESFKKAAEMLKQREMEKPISFSQLKPSEEKKIPTKENISNLKDALAKVIRKPEIPKAKPSESENRNSLPEGKATSAAGREVPEKVLRDLLEVPEK